MIKDITFNGRKNLVAQAYAAQVVAQIPLNNSKDYYLKGVGQELNYDLPALNTIKIKDGLLLVQGRMIQIVKDTYEEVEVIERPSQETVGYIIAILKTSPDIGKNTDITYKLGTGLELPELIQEDIINVTDDLNQTYECPLYSFKINSEGTISDVKKLIQPYYETQIIVDDKNDPDIINQLAVGGIVLVKKQDGDTYVVKRKTKDNTLEEIELAIGSVENAQNDGEGKNIVENYVTYEDAKKDVNLGEHWLLAAKVEVRSSKTDVETENRHIWIDNEKSTILIGSKQNVDNFFETKHENGGQSIKFGVGASGVNRGIYDSHNSKWVFLIDDAYGEHITMPSLTLKELTCSNIRVNEFLRYFSGVHITNSSYSSENFISYQNRAIYDQTWGTDRVLTYEFVRFTGTAGEERTYTFKTPFLKKPMIFRGNEVNTTESTSRGDSYGVKNISTTSCTVYFTKFNAGAQPCSLMIVGYTSRKDN